MLVQNEMMVHRGEANGPLEQQIPAGLAFGTVFTGDPDDRDQWLLKNGDDVIARHHTDELRFLVHWSAEVFADFDELKKNMDGSDDLTIDQAIDMLVDDVHKRASSSTSRRAAARSRVHRRAERRLRHRRPHHLSRRGAAERVPAGLTVKDCRMQLQTARRA